MKILLTGGAGYIGSHTAVELLAAGHDIVIGDNFSNSKKDVIDRIKQIAKRDFKLYEIDFAEAITYASSMRVTNYMQQTHWRR